MSSIESTTSTNQTDKSEIDHFAYLFLGGIFLYSLYAFWPLVVGSIIIVYLFKKFSSKSIRVGLALSLIYLLGISVGFIFPNLGSKELKETYDKAPRILYPFVVPVVIGSNLEKLKIVDSNKEEKTNKLLALKEKIKKEKSISLPIRVREVEDPKKLSWHEEVALGGPTDYPMLNLYNSENFSVVNYPRYLIVRSIAWLFNSKNEEEKIRNFRVNLILADWGLLTSGTNHYDEAMYFNQNYKEEDKKKFLKIKSEVLEIVK